MKNIRLMLLAIGLSFFAGCTTMTGGGSALVATYDRIPLNEMQALNVAPHLVNQLKSGGYTPGTVKPAVDVNNTIGMYFAKALQEAGYPVVTTQQQVASGILPIQLTTSVLNSDANTKKAAQIVISIRTPARTISQVFVIDGDSLSPVGNMTMGSQG